MLQTMEIKSNGNLKQVAPENKKKFKLQELQAAVNGLVEMIYLPSHQAYVCFNDEGEELNLTLNMRATNIVRDELRVDDVMIYGDVLIAQKSEID